MPIPTRTFAYDGDTNSLASHGTTMTIGESLPGQLVRKSAKKGFTFNIMSIGEPGLGKTALLSALFGKDLEIRKERVDGIAELQKDTMNPPIALETKTFEIEERVRLRLTVVDCKNYGEALCLKDTHLPLANFIESLFADFHKRESGFDRRNIRDNMIHCLFFFISPIGHGLTKLDIEFLKAVHKRVNIVPIIAKAEALTAAERASFKRRVKDDFERHRINVYQISDPDPDDTDEMKREIKEIQDAMPFAVCTIVRKPDNSLVERCYEWGKVDCYDRDHSDFLLLKSMLNNQMTDLCESTHDVFYEEYRVNMMRERDTLSRGSSRTPSISSRGC